MGYDALKAIRVAENPVGHVSAVACSQRALAVFIDKWIMLLGIIEPLHQIFKRCAAPIAIDGIDEFLSIASRAVKVNHDDNISVSCKEFRIPAIAPVIAPGSLRAAVDEKFHRVFLDGVEVRRLNEETFDFVVVGASEPEGLEGRHGNFGEDRVVKMS